MNEGVGEKVKDVISSSSNAFPPFQDCRLIQSFADHSHRASIRSVCASGKFLASGGADETIHLYDMKARKESGIISQHSGKIKKNRVQCISKRRKITREQNLANCICWGKSVVGIYPSSIENVK